MYFLLESVSPRWDVVSDVSRAVGQLDNRDAAWAAG